MLPLMFFANLSTSGLSETLAARLRHCKASNSSLGGASEQRLQQQTGDLALELLVSIHTALLARSQDPSIQVATETTRVRDPSGSMRSVQAKEQVGLGNRDIKLARTIQSLASRWALVPRLLHYDRTLAALVPATFAKRAPSRGQQPLDSSNRFQEIVEDDPATRQHRQLEYHNARESLFRVLQRWVSIVQAGPSAQTLSASTDIAALFLQIGVVDFLAAMLRLAFGPGPGQPSTKGSSRDEVYQVASSRVSLLLNFLSTGSAISTISSVLSSSSSNKDLGLPVFVKSVASRLLSAQLLRPDGVRALLLVTLGTADSDRDAVDDDDDDDATGSTGVTGAKNVLQRYEHLARLLGTPPAGMPTEAYMSLIVPRLVDILDPDPDTTITAPAPSHMRAAAFTLTRVSERNADMLYKELDTRVYSRFNPASGKGVPAKQLTRALSLLSAFLLFAEPSPTFFDRLLSPLVPQLLSLRCFVLGAASGGKKKVRQMRKDDEIDTVANQVDQLLRAWTRLVDAQDGSKTLMLAIQRAQRGIGEDPALSPPSDNDDTLGLYWSMEEDGVCIKYGVRPQDSISVSEQLGTLSLTDLAQAISGAGNDESKPLQLASSLGLQPDPKVVAALLKTCQRKDMAKLVLPRILDAYMVQKKSKRAALPGEQSETQLVLYLHLILLLFESFDAELLEGEVGTTLTFINFCLASPTQRRQESQREDEMPFIRAHKPGGTSSSLFDIGAKMREEQDETNEQQVDLDQDEDEDEDEDAEGDEELVTTALTLLLSLLEGNRELSTETRPLLVVIASKLERHLDSVHEEVRALAKEARMVLTARREATRGPSVSASTPVSAPLGFAQAHETYQEALRLLQDPILPVRAHGLVLLRKLVSDDPRDGGQRELLDPALVPAIRDILIQAVQDEESYLYLNAVQGLSALAASGGRQTIAALVSTYLGSERDSLASSQISQRQVDMRLRVGEALLQVVQRCGDALGPNGEWTLALYESWLREVEY